MIKHMMNFGASIQARPIDDMRDYFMSSCFKIELPFNRFRLCIFTKLYTHYDTLSRVTAFVAAVVSAFPGCRSRSAVGLECIDPQCKCIDPQCSWWSVRGQECSSFGCSYPSVQDLECSFL